MSLLKENDVFNNHSNIFFTASHRQRASCKVAGHCLLHFLKNYRTACATGSALVNAFFFLYKSHDMADMLPFSFHLQLISSNTTISDAVFSSTPSLHISTNSFIQVVSKYNEIVSRNCC